MKNSRKRSAAILCLALSLSLSLLNMSAAAALSGDSLELKKITISASVHGDGQKIEEIILAVNDASGLSVLKAEDFELAGKSYAWKNTYVGSDSASPASYRTTKADSFEATVSAVRVDEAADTVTLSIENFSPKYYYVESYALKCRTANGLSFENTIAVNDDMTFQNSNQLVEVITPVADDFAYITTPKDMGGLTAFNYFLYTPKDTSKPLPLILSNHGSGDQMTLLANRVTLAWAEPGVQDEHPAYVLAPVYPQVAGTPDTTEYQDKVIAKTMALIQKMVKEGKVDPDRIYIEGKSMGGGNTVKIANRYPEIFAAAMPLCCTNSTGGTFGAAAKNLKDLPMWFIVGEEDTLAENSLGFYDAIQIAGGVKAKISVYSPEQMRARGVGKPHDVEIISLEDGRYFDWMFNQTKQSPTSAIDYIRVNTVSPNRGHTIDTIDVYVKDASVLKGIDDPSDFKDAKLTGNTCNWASAIYKGEYRTETTVPFEAKITGVSVDSNRLTLTLAPLKGYVGNDPAKSVDETFAGYKKYFYVKDFTVTCTSNKNLTFTKDMVGDTVCPQADAFTQFTAQHTADFDYNLYTPAGYVSQGAVIKALPLVVVLHGSGDQENLLANRMAVAWTEPEILRELPAYILAPVYTKQPNVADLNATTAQTVDLIRSLICNGMVDPDRVYIMGKSMGGKNTYRAYTDYPDLFAAAMPLSGGNPFEDALQSKMAVIQNKPIQIIHSVGDSTSNDSDAVFAMLQKLGNDQAHYKKYQAEELISESVTVKPHDTEILAMEDVSFMRWLMDQRLSHEAMTRGEFVSALYAIAGQPAAGASAFTDVTADMSCATAAAWAFETGLSTGVGGNRFAPDQTLTREEAAVFLYNYAKGQSVSLPASSNAASISSWAAEAFGWAVDQGLLSVQDGPLTPQSTLTLPEADALLAAYLK